MLNPIQLSGHIQDQIAAEEIAGFDPASEEPISRRLVWEQKPNFLKIQYSRRQVEGVRTIQIILFLVSFVFLCMSSYMLYGIWTQGWGPSRENALIESITPSVLWLISASICVWALWQGLGTYELCARPDVLMFRKHGWFGPREIALYCMNTLQDIEVKECLFQTSRFVAQPGKYWTLQVTSPKHVETICVGLRREELGWIRKTLLAFLGEMIREAEREVEKEQES